MHTLHLFQFGKGNIGGTLIRQVVAQHEALKAGYSIHLEYIGFCGQSRVVINTDGLHAALDGADSIDHVLEKHPDSQAYDDNFSLFDLIVELKIPDLCVIDTTAADLSQVHLDCVREGIPVVTANKKPIADHYDIYGELKHLGRQQGNLYWYETTVGAGLPVISTLHDLMMTGDRIHEIVGCLSGTLGYICAQLDTGRPFSEIVAEAKALGYTEPDPRDDLNGMDVARKALILARDSGYKLNMSDVHVESMISETIAQAESVEAFMKALPMEDAAYAERIEKSRRRGHVLRYIATVKDGQCDVGLRSVPANSPAGGLTGPDNLVVFRSDRYADHPLVVRGPGAGPQVTAAGLFGDLIRAAIVRR